MLDEGDWLRASWEDLARELQRVAAMAHEEARLSQAWGYAEHFVTMRQEVQAASSLAAQALMMKLQERKS